MEPGGNNVLPMWRSPTGLQSTRSTKYSDWDDETLASVSVSGGLRSPSRAVQCANFLHQIERIEIHQARKSLRWRDTVFVVDVVLTEHAQDQADDVPSYQLEKRFAEFVALRNQVRHHLHQASKTACGKPSCAYCSAIAKCCADSFPPRMTRLLVSRSIWRPKLEAWLKELVQIVRSTAVANPNDSVSEQCRETSAIPAALANFFVQELSMDE